MATDETIRQGAPAGVAGATVQARAWDSDFFGVPVGQVVLQKPSQDIGSLLQDARADGLRCVYLFSPGPVQGLPGGNAPVEIRQDYAMDLPPGSPIPAEQGLFSAAGEEDLAQCRRIAWGFVPTSRFFTDGHFRMAACHDFYERYVDKEYREYPEGFWLFRREGIVEGFLTVRPDAPGSMRIALIAVAPRAQRRGIGKALIGKAVEWSLAQGASRLVVGTQRANRSACALYERTGFVLDHEQHVYHCWV